MSVKAWKRIITLFVIFIILALLVTSIFLFMKYSELSDTYDGAVADWTLKEAELTENVVDLSEYSDLDASEVNNMLQFIINMDKHESLPYQNAYPDLYVENDFAFDTVDEKVCYLTFDDGPDVNITTNILDTLKEYNVKATFFVVYKNGDAEKALYKRIVEEGHTIAVHTASHDYTKVYASIDAYLKDFNRISNHIESITGVKPEIFRFPGGSVNSYNYKIYKDLISEMFRRGYVFYDWNCSSGDAASSRPSSADIYNNVLSRANYNKKIVLLHDGKGHGATARALPEIIEGLMAQGYKLEALTKDVEPVCFVYK